MTSQLAGTGSYWTPPAGGPPQAAAYWFEAHLLTHIAPSSPVQLSGPFERQPAPAPSSVQFTNLGANWQEPTGSELEFFGTSHASRVLAPPPPFSALSSPPAPASEASGA